MLESKLGLYVGKLEVHDILLSQVSEFLISFDAMDTCLIASLKIELIKPLSFYALGSF